MVNVWGGERLGGERLTIDGNTCLAGLYQSGHDPRHPRILLDHLLHEIVLNPEPSCFRICVICIISPPRSPKPRPSPRPLPRPRPVLTKLRAISKNGRNFILMESNERFVYLKPHLLLGRQFFDEFLVVPWLVPPSLARQHIS